MSGGDAEVREVFAAVRDWGRWGPDDERGTLNHIDDEVRRSAVATVVSGRSASLARPLDPRTEPAVQLRMTTSPADASTTCRDELDIAPHGFAITHIDALAHCFFDGWAWNGRSADEAVGDRVEAGDVLALAGGILTRGVLLDVARARGVAFLGESEEVDAGDLEAAERAAGVRVRRGDAVVVRTGRAEAERAGASPERRAGIGLRAIPWLRDREVAVYSGDCVERLPSPYPGYPDYFHQIALAGMGLVLLDNPDVPLLRRLADEEGRAWFLLHVAALPIHGASGSAVNPIATF